jgi:hypothetical protein
LYAPATESGKLLVSGVIASSYVSLMDEDIVSSNMQATLSHMALAPLRMVCTIGSFSICENEEYTGEGYSTNLWRLIQFGHHFAALMIPMQLLMLWVLVPLLLVLSSAEMACAHGMWWACMLTVTLVVITTFKMKTNAKGRVEKY